MRDNSPSFFDVSIADGSSQLLLRIVSFLVLFRSFEELPSRERKEIFPKRVLSIHPGIPTSGTAPLSVTFTDTSFGSPTSWIWNFDDGSYSTEKNPGHIHVSDLRQ